MGLHRIALAMAFMAASTLSSTAGAKSNEPAGQVSAPVSFYGDQNVPDLSGLWQGTVMGVPGEGPKNNSGRTADGSPPIYWAPWPLPYKPDYQKIADERHAATQKGVALGDIGSRCLPFGLTTMLVSKNYPDEIIQTPGQVTIFPFGTFPIMIWTDGRPHPEDRAPSYNGHSIGRWEGDTLYVDTVGIKDTTPLDGMRNPHSDALHLKWTLRRVADDVLHLHLTLHDDKAFSEPVTITNIFHRKDGAKWQLLDDQSCFENNAEFSAPKPEEGFFRF